MAKKKTYSKKKRISDDRLDKIVSRVIRKEHPYCITCGESEYEKLTCSHFIKRKIKSVRWHPKNCHVQCGSCNSVHNDDTGAYSTWMVNEYGLEVLNWLTAQKYDSTKVTNEVREYWLDYWKERESKLEDI